MWVSDSSDIKVISYRMQILANEWHESKLDVRMFLDILVKVIKENSIYSQKRGPKYYIQIVKMV